jgi:hypothetical protein
MAGSDVHNEVEVEVMLIALIMAFRNWDSNTQTAATAGGGLMGSGSGLVHQPANWISGYLFPGEVASLAQSAPPRPLPKRRSNPRAAPNEESRRAEEKALCPAVSAVVLELTMHAEPSQPRGAALSA